jgi:RNA polymerase sigma factor (sigma-70 family)
MRELRPINFAVECYLRKSTYLLNFYEKEDLVQEVYLKLLEKDVFEKYDSSKNASYETYIRLTAKRIIIDLARKKRENLFSLNHVEYDSSNRGIETGDLIEEVITDSYSTVVLKELINICSEKQISPNYSMTWKDLLRYIIEGFKPKEIAIMYNISTSRVSQLVRDLRLNLIDQMA